MASYHFESGSRTGYRIRFRTDGRQKSIWLGVVDQATASTFTKHVGHIIDCDASGEPIGRATSRWLAALSDAQHGKLSKQKLIDPRENNQRGREIRLVDWIDSYIESRVDVKQSTKLTYLRARNSAVAYFGESRKLSDVSARDAEAFVRWLETEGNRRNVKDGTTGVAKNTARRTVSKMSQFFNAAVRDGLLPTDPFADLPRSMSANRDNFHFVEWSTINDCINVIDDVDWKTLLALARLGGLRIPSELNQLRWSDIDFENNRITIRATKTERYSGNGVRVCPLYPQLRPYLEAARVAPGADPEFVIRDTRYRSKEANLRTRFLKILKAAGHEPWPFLFQNLRKSRDTDLCDAGIPAQSVAAWMGHSINIMERHYLIARETDFQRAMNLSPATDVQESGNECGNNPNRQEPDCDR
jgi:integrase